MTRLKNILVFIFLLFLFIINTAVGDNINRPALFNNNKDTLAVIFRPYINNVSRDTNIESDITGITAINDVPPNDLCENAEPIFGPYPVSGFGSTIDATVDCPTLIYSYGVWYTIDLPYDINNITITICGLNEDLNNTEFNLMDDCACDDYFTVDDVTDLIEGECSTGFNGYELIFNNISGNINEDGIAYWLAIAENSEGEKMDFAYTVNVTEGEPPPEGDSCEDSFIIPALPFSDTLSNCDFNNDYNFGGKDVVYSFNIDTCLIITVSLCKTDPVFDTYLLLYGDSCGAMPIAHNDDACMAPGEAGTSEIIDTLHAGQYYILVDAYGGECGLYILDVTGVECEVMGACCTDQECVGTMNEDGCDLLNGEWFAFQDCDQGYVCPGGCYEYLPGDVNMSTETWPPATIGGDVTYLVNFFRGSAVCPSCLLDGFWASADANGDCIITGNDITKLVNFFRGTASLEFCGSYEPCWPTINDLPDSAPPDWPECE
jgi:hypothetical protein